MYTQYTVIREIKDRTEFMYTQYTVKYDPEKWNFMFEAKSRFGANYMHFTILFGGDDILIFS